MEFASPQTYAADAQTTSATEGNAPGCGTLCRRGSNSDPRLSAELPGLASSGRGRWRR